MLRAGLIGAGVGFVLAVAGAIAFPLLCNPCAAAFVGIGAGALAGVFGRPKTSGMSAGAGAKAGAISTAGSLLGQMIGASVVTISVDARAAAAAAAEMSRQFGVEVVDPELYARLYVPTMILGNLVCALLGVAVGAGLGAVGGMLWYQFKKQGEQIAAPPADP